MQTRDQHQDASCSKASKRSIGWLETIGWWDADRLAGNDRLVGYRSVGGKRSVGGNLTYDVVPQNIFLQTIASNATAEK